MDASSVGLEEEEDEEIELSLGLSIGRNFKKSPKFEPETHKTANADVDLSRENQNVSEHVEDPQRKREVHALRRQEARKKREEKLRKRGLVFGSDFSDDNVGLEAQRVQLRARDREMRENEAKIEGREGKKREITEERGENSINGGQNLSQGSVPVVPYPPLQFVPLANGFVYPCVNVVPCLGPAEIKCGKEKKNEGNVIRPFGCASLWPCQGSLSSGNLVIGGSDFERNGGRDGGNRNAASNGSPVCVSPVVSENQSSSQQGGSCSSDTGSHSSRHKAEQSQTKYTSERGISSNQTDQSTQANAKTANTTDTAVLPYIIQSSPTKQPDSESQPDLDNKPIESSNHGPLKDASDKTPSLSQMPCVSTTGNGPNGKTITGFLYRYTKTEVSIVCVCHGSSFSPAEFVEHAGGKDITHPLKHITVVPSAFG
ncbi:hypothetical protein Vadar_009589 [Vaccinium darrowii]|uniref:Uncharacterized protein n=1 Tax=Vaccinium darrowii TaxID=229202 RepID=A0ACB7ZBF4_9ERIC|nr:hypothetical protein Vadar_009589 [Vaccinium darrowii]